MSSRKVQAVGQSEFKAIDLFCGAGGLTQGLKAAGFSVIAGVEFNPIAAETYKLNHASTSLLQTDIKEIDVVELMRDLQLQPGDLDLLAGCPPCQGFSTQGTRNKPPSFDDVRNDLIFEFMKFVRHFQPKTVMLENVPGLQKDWRLQAVKAQLEDLGYVIDDDSVSVNDAANFGVPQRRRRLLLKASRLGKISSAPIVERRVTVRQAIGNLPMAGASGDELHDLISKHSPRVQQIIRATPKNGGSRADTPQDLWLPCHKKRPGSYRDVYGRMKWDDVAPTITGGCHNPSKGRFIHPEFDRAITLREAAILQTFPESYSFPTKAGKDAIALMIGNALPPEFIRQHAVKYMEHLQSEVQKCLN